MKQAHLAYIYKLSVVTTDEDNDVIAPELLAGISHSQKQLTSTNIGVLATALWLNLAIGDDVLSVYGLILFDESQMPKHL